MEFGNNQSLFISKLAVKCVGDHKQATFRTNNSPKNKQYRDDKIKDYFIKQSNSGICKISYDNTSRRCNSEICEFINTIHSDFESSLCSCDEFANCEIENIGVYIIDKKHMEQYCSHYTPVILVYQSGSNIPFMHDCQVLNYGNSKGTTFERVVIIPIGTVKPFIKEKKSIAFNQTKAKFYVACTRAKHSVVFVMDGPSDKDLFIPCTITLGDIDVPALKYTAK